MIRYLLTLAAGVADALAGREKLTATPAAAMTVVTAFSSPWLNMATSFAGAGGGPLLLVSAWPARNLMIQQGEVSVLDVAGIAAWAWP
jgi:hypothetical protein